MDRNGASAWQVVLGVVAVVLVVGLIFATQGLILAAIVGVLLIVGLGALLSRVQPPEEQ